MFELMGKEINAILDAQTILIWTYMSSEGSDEPAASTHEVETQIKTCAKI